MEGLGVIAEEVVQTPKLQYARLISSLSVRCVPIAC